MYQVWKESNQNFGRSRHLKKKLTDDEDDEDEDADDDDDNADDAEPPQ